MDSASTAALCDSDDGFRLIPCLLCDEVVPSSRIHRHVEGHVGLQRQEPTASVAQADAAYVSFFDGNATVTRIS